MACGLGGMSEAENLEDDNGEEEHRREEGDVEGLAFEEWRMFFGAENMHCEGDWHQGFRGVGINLVRCLEEGLDLIETGVRD